MGQRLERFANSDRSLSNQLGNLSTWKQEGALESTTPGLRWGVQIANASSRKVEPRALADRPVAPFGKRLRILVVEDNRDAAHSLRILLELLGHQVEVAYTGPEGLERALEWLPEVVLSDIGLPGGLDGWALAKELRKNPATAHVRLIAITGYGSEEDRRHSREAQFDYHLTKPVDPALLQEIIVGELE